VIESRMGDIFTHFGIGVRHAANEPGRGGCAGTRPVSVAVDLKPAVSYQNSGHGCSANSTFTGNGTTGNILKELLPQKTD